MFKPTRTLAASQVEKSTVNTNEYGSTHHRSFDTSPAVTSMATTMAAAAADRRQNPVVNQAAPVPVAATANKACGIDAPACESCQG